MRKKIIIFLYFTLTGRETGRNLPPSGRSAKFSGKNREKGLTIAEILCILIRHLNEASRFLVKGFDAELCNGSTCDSDSHCEGSNPSTETKRQQKLQFTFRGISQVVAR